MLLLPRRDHFAVFLLLPRSLLQLVAFFERIFPDCFFIQARLWPAPLRRLCIGFDSDSNSDIGLSFMLTKSIHLLCPGAPQSMLGLIALWFTTLQDLLSFMLCCWLPPFAHLALPANQLAPCLANAGGAC